MKLHEYQAKDVLRAAGLPVPHGVVVTTPDQAAQAAESMGRVVIKAQVHVGGRGKAGGVKVASTPADARTIAQAILGMDIKGLRVNEVLVEPALAIAREYYVGITLDRDNRHFTLMLSAMGGVDIEEVAEHHPEAIVRIGIDPLIGLPDYVLRQALWDAGFDAAQHRAITAVLHSLYDVAVARDTTLAEINPLAITNDGSVVVADAKVDIDDNALFRQAGLLQYRDSSFDDPMDRLAAEQGLTYVHLGGEVGIIGNGAGLVMTTLDVVTAAGSKPANFLDVGGGGRADQVRRALTMVLGDPEVKAVIFNIFGGITRGDEVARGMLEAAQSMTITVPIVVRLTGTQAEEGRRLLEGSAFIPAASAQEAAQKARTLIAGH